MASTSTPDGTSTPCMVLPPELRNKIYRLCIPHHNAFIYSHDGEYLYMQNRPAGWVAPSWHTANRHTFSNRYSYFSEGSGHSCHCAAGTTSMDQQVSRLSGMMTGSEYIPPSSCPRPYSGVLIPQRWSGVSQESCPVCKRYKFNVPTHRRTALPGLLLVCRQITKEVEAMLYGTNVFVMRATGYPLTTLGGFNVRKLRQVIIDMTPLKSHRTPPAWNWHFWRDLFGRLDTLKIAARVEIISRTKSDPPRFITNETSIRRYFEFLHRTLPEDMKIVVDTRNCKETRAISEECMPGRCEYQAIIGPDDKLASSVLRVLFGIQTTTQ